MSNTELKNPFKKNGRFVAGTILTIIEGVISATASFSVFILVSWILEKTINMEKIYTLTIIVAICFALRFVLYGIGYTMGQVGGATVSKQIRLFLGEKCKRIPIKKFAMGQSGTYINILTDNVAKYERVLTHKLPNIVKNGAIIIMILGFCVSIYLPAALVMLVAVLLFVPQMFISFRIANVYGGQRAKVYNETVSNVVEYISGIQTLRAYGMTGEKHKSLTQSLKEFSNVNYIYEAKGIPVAFLFNSLQWLSLPAVMLVSLTPWKNGLISDSRYLMLCMVPILLAKLLMSTAIDIFSFKDMFISKGYITDLINEKEEVQNDSRYCPDSYEITFKNVDFSYNEGQKILSDVNLTIPAGKLTAIVGDSGSGKSTVMNLICKYYEPDKGDIYVGNTNIASYSSEDVLSKISLVDQDVFLFDDTVIENIRHARPTATDEEIREACRSANCQEFIDKMPKGYDTKIGENGSLLSGGERQRLSIARAILRDSPIILLDEATSALDIENELKVKKAISNLICAGKTVVMIAHTLSIVRNADQILVLDNKSVAEMGSHDSLITKQGKYYRMWSV